MATTPNYSATSIGGVSAVNPNAAGDYQAYIDAAYNATKSRLDPIFDQNKAAYDQQMQNMGIPIGGEAYNSSFNQLNQSFNDAYSQAAFDAMGFGLGAQAQDFSQDATRSQLANALLQSQWGNQTSAYGMDLQNEFNYANLAEQASQFDDQLGFNYAGLDYNYANLGEQARQYDSTLDYNYWNTGNQFDYMYDRADQSDLQWLTGLNYDIWNDQNTLNRYSDVMGQGLIGLNIPNTPNPAGGVTAGQNSNMFNYAQQYGQYGDWWDSLFNLGSRTAQQAGG